MSKRARKDPKQAELEKMPERSPLGKKAIEYLVAREKLETAKGRLDVLKTELIELFVEKGQTSIKVEGMTVFYSHVETDQVKVKQGE